MTLLPTALEEAAKARIAEQYGEDAESGFGDHFSELLEAFKQEAATAITAYLAQAGKEGWVMVPAGLARKVTSIARRNEGAPEIHELSSMLAQNGGEG